MARATIKHGRYPFWGERVIVPAVPLGLFVLAKVMPASACDTSAVAASRVDALIVITAVTWILLTLASAWRALFVRLSWGPEWVEQRTPFAIKRLYWTDAVEFEPAWRGGGYLSCGATIIRVDGDLSNERSLRATATSRIRKRKREAAALAEAKELLLRVSPKRHQTDEPPAELNSIQSATRPLAPARF